MSWWPCGNLLCNPMFLAKVPVGDLVVITGPSPGSVPKASSGTCAIVTYDVIARCVHGVRLGYLRASGNLMTLPPLAVSSKVLAVFFLILLPFLVAVLSVRWDSRNRTCLLLLVCVLCVPTVPSCLQSFRILSI